MYCRFCGAKTPSDSRFCPRCGKRIGEGVVAPTPGAVERFRLRTPYPWAGLLFAAFLWWAFVSTAPEVFDYDRVAVSIELDGTSAAPEDGLYRQHFDVVVENLGDEPVFEVRVEFRARIEAAGPARVDSEFRGQRVTLLSEGVTAPLELVLTDDVDPGGRRRYPIDGIVTAMPPFRVWYEVANAVTGEVLADLSHSEPADDSPAQTARR